MTGIYYLDAKGPEKTRIYAIGDVHGRLDLLERMLGQIDAQIAVKQPVDWRVIMLGDYVDRGPDSRGVVDLLIRRREADSRFIVLCGNHDAGALDFLENPLGRGALLFTHHGGVQTLASYGVQSRLRSEGEILAAVRQFGTAIPEAHIDFLADLPRSASFGDFFFCHAGIRPGIPLDEQDSEDLIWIRNEFLNYPGLHPKVIVHGHTPHDEPEVLANRVNVDTHAYASGVLTALVINGASKELISVEGPTGRWR